MSDAADQIASEYASARSAGRRLDGRKPGDDAAGARMYAKIVAERHAQRSTAAAA